MTKTIQAAELLAQLDGNSAGELALFDAREEGVFGHRHILYAACLSLSQLELRVADLIPRAGTPVVICDAGGGEAELAASRMLALGYSDISVLEGGLDAWEAAGYELFSGLNVPSKAFGEFIEHEYGTPSVSADELKAMMDNGENMVVLDSRPMAEYSMMNIPTGIDCPGAELVHRVHEVVPDPETTVVVNCAGRTRSIIGAQSLIDANIPNKVVALRNGTMGWHLAGHKLEHGRNTHAPTPSPEAAQLGRERAEVAGRRFGVRMVDAATLDTWRAECDQHTLYVLDVRTIQEFEASRVADSRHAPGGQLVQGTDTYIVTRGARVVLIDDAMTRALMTAGWLIQLGWPDVYVLESGLDGQKTVSGPRDVEVPGDPGATVTAISPSEAQAAVTAGDAILIDLQRSLGHREKHAEGARFAIRARLAADLDAAGKSGTVLLLAENDALARLAAAELSASGRAAKVVTGGNAAWEAAGLTMAAGSGNPLSSPDDVYMRPYDRSSQAEVEKAMNDYLTWEIALVEQIQRPGGISFQSYPE
ncbi:MAG: thiosulfate sulfurtransferase [Rhodospirillaceae bacterium]|nr:thiosulfate sulfurtransferase [Rhodospirillaceae bacterium]